MKKMIGREFVFLLRGGVSGTQRLHSINDKQNSINEKQT
jgi:hypothetical protein